MGSDDMDQQVLDFIDVVNINLKGALRVGEVLCDDKSMDKGSLPHCAQWDDENNSQISVHRQ